MKLFKILQIFIQTVFERLTAYIMDNLTSTLFILIINAFVSVMFLGIQENTYNHDVYNHLNIYLLYFTISCAALILIVLVFIFYIIYIIVDNIKDFFKDSWKISKRKYDDMNKNNA